jgi:tetratricopeptide (TPR) repeat protein
VRARARESIGVWERLGDEAGRIGAFHMLAYVNFGEENWEAARELFTANLEAARRAGFRAYVATESGNLAAVEREVGNLERAEALARESLAISRELGSAYMIPYGLADLGGLAAERGRYERAARLLGAAERAFAEAGLVMDPGSEPVFRRDEARTREALGERFRDAWEAGASLGTEAACELALREAP